MIQVRRVLAALASPEECMSLRRILDGQEWALSAAHAFPDASKILRSASFGLVICSSRFADGYCWRDLLSEIRSMAVAPQLIVADRLADESLWAEVLNLGCYDLLMTPFEPDEVLRVLPMAWDSWKRNTTQTDASSKQPTSSVKALAAAVGYYPSAAKIPSGW